MKTITNQQANSFLAKLLKPFVKLHDFLERRDLPESTQQLIAIAPVGTLFTGALALVALLAVAQTMVLPVLLGVAGTIAAIGVLGVSANALIKSVNKREHIDAINGAGQTVRGSAYDIAVVSSLENEINKLQRRLDVTTDTAMQDALNRRIGDAFAKAAPVIQRLSVIEDPQAQAGETPTYSFAIKREQVIVQRVAAGA